jgi:hypothetical protein
MHVCSVSNIRFEVSLNTSMNSINICADRVVSLYPENSAVKFQVNLPKALDWFNKELDDVRSGDSEFIKTYNTVYCECQEDQVLNPETRDDLILGIFYDPDQAGDHTAV